MNFCKIFVFITLRCNVVLFWFSSMKEIIILITFSGPCEALALTSDMLCMLSIKFLPLNLSVAWDLFHLIKFGRNNTMPISMTWLKTPEHVSCWFLQLPKFIFLYSPPCSVSNEWPLSLNGLKPTYCNIFIPERNLFPCELTFQSLGWYCTVAFLEMSALSVCHNSDTSSRSPFDVSFH